ncbi:MAG: anti-sigma factor family protein [Thermodesulfobacteriota bacterium]
MVEGTPNRLPRSKEVDTCKRETSLISDYLTGELDTETTLAFEEQLCKCSDCIAFLNTYKKTIQNTRSFLRKKS